MLLVLTRGRLRALTRKSDMIMCMLWKFYLTAVGKTTVAGKGPGKGENTQSDGSQSLVSIRTTGRTCSISHRWAAPPQPLERGLRICILTRPEVVLMQLV